MNRFKFVELDKLNKEISQIVDKKTDIDQLDQMYFDILFEEFGEQIEFLNTKGRVSKAEIVEFLSMENSKVGNPEAKQRFLDLCKNFENFGISLKKDERVAN